MCFTHGNVLFCCLFYSICRDEVSNQHQRQEGKTLTDQHTWLFLGCCASEQCCPRARVTRCAAATCWPAGACTRTDCRRYLAAVGSRASSRSEETIWCWSRRSTIWSKGTFTPWVWTAAALSDTSERLWEVQVWCGFEEKPEKKKEKLTRSEFCSRKFNLALPE